MFNGISLVVEWGWYDINIISHGVVPYGNLWHHQTYFLALLESPSLLIQLAH